MTAAMDEIAAAPASGEDIEPPRRKGRGVGGFRGAALRDWRTSRGYDQEALALATRREAARQGLTAAAAAGLLGEDDRDERIALADAVTITRKMTRRQIAGATETLRDLTADLAVRDDLETSLDMTAKEFGDLTRGISAGQVSHLEQGRRNPTMGTLNLLCAALGCDQEDLVYLPGLQLATAASMRGPQDGAGDGQDQDQ